MTQTTDDVNDNGDCTSSGGHHTDRIFTFPSPLTTNERKKYFLLLLFGSTCFCDVCVRVSVFFSSSRCFSSLHFTSLVYSYAHHKQNFLFYTYLNSFSCHTMQHNARCKINHFLSGFHVIDAMPENSMKIDLKLSVVANRLFVCRFEWNFIEQNT